MPILIGKKMVGILKILIKPIFYINLYVYFLKMAPEDAYFTQMPGMKFYLTVENFAYKMREYHV